MFDWFYRYLLLCHTIPFSCSCRVCVFAFIQDPSSTAAKGNYHGSVPVEPLGPFTLASGPDMLANVSK